MLKSRITPENIQALSNDSKIKKFFKNCLPNDVLYELSFNVTRKNNSDTVNMVVNYHDLINQANQNYNRILNSKGKKYIKSIFGKKPVVFELKLESDFGLDEQVVKQFKSNVELLAKNNTFENGFNDSLPITYYTDFLYEIIFPLEIKRKLNLPDATQIYGVYFETMMKKIAQTNSNNYQELESTTNFLRKWREYIKDSFLEEINVKLKTYKDSSGKKVALTISLNKDLNEILSSDKIQQAKKYLYYKTTLNKIEKAIIRLSELETKCESLMEQIQCVRKQSIQIQLAFNKIDSIRDRNLILFQEAPNVDILEKCLNTFSEDLSDIKEKTVWNLNVIQQIKFDINSLYYDYRIQQHNAKLQAKMARSIQVSNAPQRHEPSPQTFFAYHPVEAFHTMSVIKEIRQAAQDKLQAQQKKQDAKDARTNASEKVIEDETSQSNAAMFLCYPGIKENLEILPFAIDPDLTIYITNYLPQECQNHPQSKQFQTTIERTKVIAKDSMGQNGIKIYSPDMAVVKISDGSRLICISHSLPDEKGIIFIPTQVVTHKEYETLINDASKMQQLAKRNREKCFVEIKINEFIESEGTSEHHSTNVLYGNH